MERFFGTLHDMEVFVPSYTGNDITHKPARMNRGEFLHRELYARLGGRPLTMRETHHAIARWFAEYSLRPQRGRHLAGRTPSEIFEAGRGPGVDMNRLTQMMMRKEIRAISKDGIQWSGRWYWHEALANRRHPVVIRYDEHFSPHEIHVFTTDGQWLCDARDREHYKIAAGVHPAARALGTDEQRAELEAAVHLKKGQEKEAESSVTYMLNHVVLPEVEQMQAALPAPPAKVLRFKAAAKSPVMSAETIAAIEAIQRVDFDTNSDEKAYKPASLCRFKDELAKYEYLFRVRHERELELTAEDQSWLESFEASPTYARCYKRRFDSMRAVFAQWRSA